MNYEYQAKVFLKKKEYIRAENVLKKIIALKGQEGQDDKVKKAKKNCQVVRFKRSV